MPVSWTHLCRLCAASSDLNEDAIDSTSNLSQIILKYLSISIKNDDDLSVRICRKCEEKVTDFHTFASECERIQSMFEEYKNESIFDNLDLQLVKTENNEEIEIKQEIKYDYSDDDNLDNTEFIVPIEKKRSRNSPEDKLRRSKRKKIETENVTNGVVLKNEIKVKIKTDNKKKTENKPKKIDVKRNPYRTKKIDYNVFKFDCHLCELKYENWEKLQSHVSSAHGTRPNVKCICGKMLNNKPSLQRHSRKHNPDRCLVCDTCHKTFGSRKEIINHVKVHMPKIKSHICCICAKKFSSRKILQSHEQTHKPQEERLTWLCEICNTRFVSKFGLKSHTRNIHLKLRPFMCHLCGRSFVNRADLNEHYVTHSNQRNFLCDRCNKRFKTKQALMRHTDSHPDTAYQCPHCPMLLNTRSTLRNHLSVHDEGPSHYCPVCKKGFKRQKDVKSHMKQHTGERPFTCPWCQRTFTSDSNCRIHKRRMHPIEFEQAEKQKPITFYAERKKGGPRKIIEVPLPSKQPNVTRQNDSDNKEPEETADFQM